jgi:phosphate starvation-inducible PhoH-like protein
MKLLLLLLSFISGVFAVKYSITNAKQLKYQSAINCKKTNIIISTGPAGTGKTLIACQEAIKLLKESDIDKIIITRPVVTAEENLGYLPGTFQDKLYPYMIPIYDYFLEHYTKDSLANLINTEKLEIAPLAYMRGRTFKNAIIIADEMQNTTPLQMKMILTRIGENSKLIITGDLDQNDIKVYNGLQNLLDLINIKYPLYHELVKDGIQYINLDKSCIQRHPIIEKIIDLYK